MASPQIVHPSAKANAVRHVEALRYRVCVCVCMCACVCRKILCREELRFQAPAPLWGTFASRAPSSPSSHTHSHTKRFFFSSFFFVAISQPPMSG